jgi:hypothetical protein
MPRDYGAPYEPEWMRVAREHREAAVHEQRVREVAQQNAAAHYDFLKQHGARVTITVGGLTLESTGHDLDDAITQARLRLYELKQADDEARRASRSLTWGT